MRPPAPFTLHVQTFQQGKWIWVALPFKDIGAARHVEETARAQKRNHFLEFNTSTPQAARNYTP